MSQTAFALSNKQQLSMSPRLQQAVRLLQMSALEFQQELLQQLADNPFLEDSEPAADAQADDDGAATDDDRESLAATAEASAGDEHAQAPAEPEASPLEAVDFDDLPNTSAELPDSDRSISSDGNHDPCQWLHAEISLRSHLHEQIRGARLSERVALAAALVIETLGDDGYLREDLAEVARDLALDEPLSDEEMAAGIETVQQFDPLGVAARDLSECLGLQLRALDPATPGRKLALRLVASHLNLLGRHDYTSLRRHLDCSADALLLAHSLIRRLDPKPGERFTAPRTDYVEPDVLVVEQRGRLMTVINPAVLPRARLNRDCVDLMRQVSGQRHPAMLAQLQEARWLLRNAAQRHMTIRRVAEVIVSRQRGFFQYGAVAMRPLLLRDVADELGLHESTLSRATANKYMATPRGTYEFRHFFSRQLPTSTGGTCSAAAVRALIRDMIETENCDEPLSDVHLARLLTDSGICVARRTVAKYRNQLKLPAWELRHLP